MTERNALPANTPTELVDFRGVASRSKHIEILQKFTHGAVTIGYYRHRQNAGALIGTSQFSVLINEGGQYEMDWHLPESGQAEQVWIEQGDIQLHPSDMLVYKRWRHPSRMLFFAIDPSFVAQIAGEVFDDHAKTLRPYIGLRDPVVGGMAEAWRAELRQRGAGGRVHAEALATSLIVHVFRTYGDGTVNIKMASGGMNGARLKRAIDYIEEHFAEDVSLCTLASLAGFSPHHFSEVFKTATGKAPHQYLTDLRILHAKELLLGTDMPISQIALTVGFSSGQSHFTLNFRKVTGTTPLRYRLAGRLGLIGGRSR